MIRRRVRKLAVRAVVRGPQGPPHRLHPLWPLQSMVFRLLEPFAHSLLRREIKDLAPNAGDFTWRKQTCFGGLFQRVVAVRKTADLP